MAFVAAEGLLQLGYLAVWSLGNRSDTTPTSDRSTPSILCVGDSFTYGMGASSPQKSYPGQLEQRLRSAGAECRVENRGWPGRDSRQMLESFDALLAATKPRFVCIAIGVNDSWRRPEELVLPEAPVTTGPVSAREPYEWTFRLWRLVQAFRTADPFRDKPQATAIEAPPVDTAFVVGNWKVVDSDVKLRLDADGSGSLGASALRWQAAGSQLTITPTGLPAIAGTWRANAGDLIIGVANPRFEMRLARASGAAPVDSQALGWKAMEDADWPKAEAAFRAAIEEASPDQTNLPILHGALASAQIAGGKQDEASVQLATVRKLHAERNSRESAEGLMNALSSLGFEQEAEAVVDKALAEGKESPGLLLRSAQFAANRKDLDRARREIDTAIALAMRAKWKSVAYMHRIKAGFYRGPEDMASFAECVLAAHMDDGSTDLTRQLLFNWNGSAEDKDAALTRAFDAHGTAGETRKLLIELRRETMGDERSQWHAVLRSHLRQAIVRSRRAGATPILATYPFQIDTRWVLKALAAEEGCPFVEIDTVFEKVRRAEPDRVLNVQDGHCNDDGYGIMADELARAILAAAPPRQAPGK